MKINKLKLNNFRNHTQFSIDVDKSVIAITGNNGAGKTNILESISLLVPGKGFRKSRITELQRQGYAEPWSIYSEVETNDDITKIGTGFDPQKFLETGKEKRIVKINGETQRGQNSLAEYVSMIWLTPNDDQTFQSDTTAREFLDRICELFYPDYASQIAVYNNARSQRRKLLMQNKMDDNWLSALEVQMVQKATSITHSRFEVLERINRSMELTKNSTFPAARVEIEGEIEDIIRTKKAVEAEREYLEILKNSRSQDAYMGKTLHGIHRTKLKVTHQEKNQRAEYCSTGEQKAMLLSITLASVVAKSNFSGVTPIVILDEIIAHLDSEKRRKLIQFLLDVNAQVWASAVDFNDFEDVKKKVQNIAL